MHLLASETSRFFRTKCDPISLFFVAADGFPSARVKRLVVCSLRAQKESCCAGLRLAASLTLG
jgi:hypothetical protein